MADRFFSDEPITSGRVVLAGAEAHHLIHVLRAAPGLRVVLFDGLGDEFQAAVARIGRSSVELEIESRETIDRELPFDLTLAVAMPKGDRQRWLVEKAVELGVAKLVPLRTARSVAQPVDAALARLHRAVVEASKQCGRNRLMRVEPPQDWANYTTGSETTALRLLAHPKFAKATDFGSLSDVAPQGVICAVGPEGGLTDEEVSLGLDAGWMAIDLGPRILRIETAAVALASLAAIRWGLAKTPRRVKIDAP